MLMKQVQSVSTMNLTVGQTMGTIESLQLMKDQYNMMKEVSDAQSKAFKVFSLAILLRHRMSTLMNI